MTTYAAGQSATIDIPANAQYTISTTDDAYVDIIAGVNGAGTSDRLFGNRKLKVYGPWSVTARIAVRSIAGTVTVDSAISAPVTATTNLTGRIKNPTAGTANLGKWLRDDYPVPLREIAALSQVTNAATGGTVTPTIDADSPLGGAALKLAIGAGVTQHDVTLSGLNLEAWKNGRAKLSVLAYFEETRAISQIQCFIGTDTGFGTSLRVDYKLANDGVNHGAGLHIITIEPNLFAADTLVGTETITAIRFRLQRSGTPISNGIQNLPGNVATNAVATNMWIKGVYLHKPRLPFVVLTFDDASVSWMTYLRTELLSRNLRGTFGINKNDVGTNPAIFCDESQLATLYADGHDFASHNLTNTAYSIANHDAYVAEFDACLSWLRGKGWTNRNDYHPFVQGLFNPDLSRALAQRGVKYMRTVFSRNLERNHFGAGVIMPSLSLGSGTSLAAAKTRISQAKTRQQDVVVMGHVFAPTAADTVTWAIGDMALFLDYLLAEREAGTIGGVGSLSEYLQYIGVE